MTNPKAFLYPCLLHFRLPYYLTGTRPNVQRLHSTVFKRLRCARIISAAFSSLRFVCYRLLLVSTPSHHHFRHCAHLVRHRPKSVHGANPPTVTLQFTPPAAGLKAILKDTTCGYLLAGYRIRMGEAFVRGKRLRNRGWSTEE